MFLKCNRTGNLMFSTKEAERHAEDTGFQDFAQVAPEQQVFVVAAGRALKLFWDMPEFERFKQRTYRRSFRYARYDGGTIDEQAQRSGCAVAVGCDGRQQRR